MEADNQSQYDLTGKITIAKFLPDFSGSYSAVYHGNLGHNLVAVKVLKAVGAIPTIRRELHRKRTIWASLNHPNILPFYGYADDEPFQPFGALISPWYQNGDAAHFLPQRGSSLTEAARVELWRGVVEGVAFLHGSTPVIVHADLKPTNVLIDDQGSPRICDFGLASLLRDSSVDPSGMTTTTEHTGTKRYLAPELVNQKKAIPTTASDIWTLGCLGLEFVYSKIPYEHLENPHRTCIVDIRDGIPPARREAIGDANDPKRGLLVWCWASVPETRPSAIELRHYLCQPEVRLDSNLEGITPRLQERNETRLADNQDIRELITRLQQENLLLKQNHLNFTIPTDLRLPPSQRHENPFDLGGEWHVHEIGRTDWSISRPETYSSGTYHFTMITSNTFRGIGAEIDRFSSGHDAVSYTFKVTNGTIAPDGDISWLCDSDDISGQWSIQAKLASNGTTMHGQFSAVSGNVCGGIDTYTRVR